MKKSLRQRVLFLIFTFVLVLVLVSVWMSYKNIKETGDEFYYNTASTVAETCRLIIDRDSIQNYVQTGERNNSYYETWNKLIDYRNTNEDIERLSVVSFDRNGCHYIFETDLSPQSAFLGDSCDFDARQQEVRDKLIQGKEVLTIQYDTRMDVYRPLLSSYDMPVGYVVVGLSTVRAKKEQARYILETLLVLIGLTFVVAIIFAWNLSRTVIRPINKLSAAAASYAGTIAEEGQSALQKLKIRTGDEIEQLFHSMQKMETDLLNSASKLLMETWNSNHDSMTGMYNKRYLQEFMGQYVQNKALGVFYFDVDNLKKMNDICGHEQGDAVICGTADFIKKYESSEEAFGFRMGGDEFLLIVSPCPQEHAEELFRTMQNDPERELTPPDSQVNCRISMGFVWSDSGENLEGLVKLADKKMYQDKKSHRE